MTVASTHIDFSADVALHDRGRIPPASPRTAGSAYAPKSGLRRLSDEAVLALVARSDEAALAELYARFGRAAFRLAVRVLRDRGLAEAAVEEAFTIGWRTAGGFRRERATVSTWLLTIVHRRAVDSVRREQRHRTEPLDGLPHPGGEAADEEALRREQRRIVQHALARLPAEQRQVLELAY